MEKVKNLVSKVTDSLSNINTVIFCLSFVIFFVLYKATFSGSLDIIVIE